jgi:hypothetical protein
MSFGADRLASARAKSLLLSIERKDLYSACTFRLHTVFPRLEMGLALSAGRSRQFSCESSWEISYFGRDTCDICITCDIT